MKKRVQPTTVVDNELSSLLQHNDRPTWRPQSTQQRKMMAHLTKQRAEKRRGRQLTAASRGGSAVGRSRGASGVGSPEASVAASIVSDAPFSSLGLNGQPPPWLNEQPTGHHPRHPPAPPTKTLSSPQCEGNHELQRRTGIPDTYTPHVGFSIACDNCGKKELHHEPFFYHCPLCKFDCCSTCMIGKRNIAAAKRYDMQQKFYNNAASESQVSGLDSARPHHNKVKPPLDGNNHKTNWMRMDDPASNDPRWRMRGAFNQSAANVSKNAARAAPHVEDADGGAAGSLRQKISIGDEVELSPPRDRDDADDDAALGVRGVVTGFNRGRIGVSIPGRKEEQAKGVLPDRITRPGSATKVSALHPGQYPKGAVVEVCNTHTPADGRRGIVVDSLHNRPVCNPFSPTPRSAASDTGSSFSPRPPTTVEIDLFPDAQSFAQRRGAQRYRLPMENLTLPVGVHVRLVNTGSEKLENRVGTITGYNRGRVGVRLRATGEMVGALPDWIKPASADEADRPQQERQPEASRAPAPAPRKEKPAPSPSAVKHLLNTIRSALLHAGGALAFVNLRRSLAIFPPTILGLTQVFARVGLHDVAQDPATVETIFNVFSSSGSLDTAALASSLRRRIPDKRERWLTKLFSELDRDGSGVVPTGYLKKFYIPTNGPLSPDHLLENMRVEQSEFMNFYRDLSAAISSDNHFHTILTTTWRVPL
ncbi:Crustacean calcium-binding protein 23 [Diplonema papillatum]|nr:Crustacean calcium-binding protein 23 [Diplonema papillatum]